MGTRGATLLSGPAIGSGALSATQLRRAVPVAVATPDAELELATEASLVRVGPPSGATTDEVAFAFVRVRNTGTRTRCPQATATFAGPTGGATDSALRATSSRGCLAPAEQAWLVATTSGGITPDAERVVLAFGPDARALAVATRARIVPRGYATRPRLASTTVTVELVNDGPGWGQLDGAASVVLLDEEGGPLGGCVVDDALSAAVAPRGLVTFGCRLRFEGTASRVLVVAASRDAEPPPAARQDPG